MTDQWQPSAASRIDWTKVLEDIAYVLGEPQAGNELLRTPVGIRELARSLGVPYGTLRGWQEGSEPKHSDGERILVFWCRLTGKARTFAHVDRFVYSASKAGASAPIRTTSDKPKAADAALVPPAGWG